MRREPPITFRGALKILGHHERPVLDRLNTLTGGLVLASGAGVGVAAVGGAVMAPLALLAPLWGWVDQKNEATGLLRGLLNKASDRLAGTRGFERHELIAAAHTTIAMSAVFEVVREEMGEELYDRLKVTDDEMMVLVTGRWQEHGESIVRRLYSGSLPAPCATHGFFENLERIEEWAVGICIEISAFVGVLSGSHGSIRDGERYDTDVVFPLIGDIFVNPRYRLASAGSSTSPADETWWAEQKVFDNIEVLIATHVTGPEASRLPLLLLGHPGAGKSLLTKVLAARLPESSYTVVRVPLRRVDANAPVWQQIQQALDDSTHGRVDWSTLVDQSVKTVRVVLLDGLDELLQATSHDRTGYLQEIAEFQRREADQDQPVIVVVTSRTVVADRVDIAPGTPIVKLEDFDESQVKRWLTGWCDANATPIATGTVRRLTEDIALAHFDLTRQPLLLLMLALYYGDPKVPAIDTELSPIDLYDRLFDNFARREVLKRPGKKLHGSRLDAAVNDQLHRLSIAALAMFNRGRQGITESELGDDLTKLHDDTPGELGKDELGQRVLGEFFFVHTAEARVSAVRRNYEFLHATFGEYLVAALVVETIADIAEAALGGRRGPRDPEDNLLYALLSHQPLAVRRPVVDFAAQLIAGMPSAERQRIAQTLERLISCYRRRQGSGRYVEYRPIATDHVRQLAAYSANLVLLRAVVDEEGVLLSTLWPEEESRQEQWRSTVNLWEAGLDTHGWQALLSVVECTDGVVRLTDFILWWEFSDLLGARLRNDLDLERRLRTGLAVHDGLTYFAEPDSWQDMMVSWIIAAKALPADQTPHCVHITPPNDTPADVVAIVHKAICQLLLHRSAGWRYEAVRQILSWALSTDGSSVEPSVLAAVLTAHPKLLQDMPQLVDSRNFRGLAKAVAVLKSYGGEAPYKHLLEDLCRQIEVDMDPRDASTIRYLSDEAALLFRMVLADFQQDPVHLPGTATTSLSFSIRSGETEGDTHIIIPVG